MRLKTLPVVKSCSISYVSSFPYHFCTFCILHLLLTQYKLYNDCRVKAIFLFCIIGLEQIYYVITGFTPHKPAFLLPALPH